MFDEGYNKQLNKLLIINMFIYKHIYIYIYESFVNNVL